MNPRLKLALIQHKGEKGFATVIAMGLGLVMILVGLTMAIRSQSDVTLSSTQKSTSRALSAAEVGVTRYQYLLNRVSELAKENDPQWSTAITNITSCSRISININRYLTTAGWQNIASPSDTTQGQYKLVSYAYQKNLAVSDPANAAAGTLLGTGILTIQGRVNVSGTGDNDITSRTSTARLEVQIPVRQSNITYPAALWTKTGSTMDGNQKVDGDILVNCDTTPPAANVVGIGTARKSAGIVPTTPDLPPAAEYTDLGAISANMTLGTTGTPSPVSPTYPGRSVYRVRSMGRVDITVPVGAKVVIFLTGNINKNTTIIHNCAGQSNCSPSDILIIGTGTDVALGSRSICLNGSNSLSAFILAPTYDVGVDGGGNASPIIAGNVWVNTWGLLCGSSSNKVVITQDPVTVNWANVSNIIPGIDPILQSLPPRIDLPSSWTKKPVP